MKYHIQVPEIMSDDMCSEMISVYTEKICEAELVIFDFKLVKDIEPSGLLRMQKISTKINPNCDFKIVNANPKIKYLLQFTPLGKFI